MSKYSPEIEILTLLHKSGEIDGCSILTEITKIVPPETKDHYTRIICVLADMHKNGLINSTPAPNIKNPNSTYSITAKGLKLLENKYQNHKVKRKHWRQQLVHDLIVAMTGALLSNLDKIYIMIIGVLNNLLNG